MFDFCTLNSAAYQCRLCLSNSSLDVYLASYFNLFLVVCYALMVTNNVLQSISKFIPVVAEDIYEANEAADDLLICHCCDLSLLEICDFDLLYFDGCQ